MEASSITIANARELGPPSEWEPWVVYVGRENKRRGLKASPLANPFLVGKPPAWTKHTTTQDGMLCPWGWERRHTATRESAILSYRRKWLVPILRMDETSLLKRAVVAELDRLRALLKEHGKLVLVGGPHAEVIKEVLLEGMA